MNIAEMIILSAALSIDALGIGASCRLKGIKTPIISKLTIALISAVLTAAAVLTGGMISGFLTEKLAAVAGAILLIMLGIYIIYGAVSEDRKKITPADENPVETAAMILKKPDACDFDRSHSVELKEAIYIGAAISADSFAAGLGIGRDGLWIPVF